MHLLSWAWTPKYRGKIDKQQAGISGNRKVVRKQQADCPPAPIELIQTDAQAVRRPSLDIRYESNEPELDQFLYVGEKVEGPHGDDILAWLETTYRRSRGFEFGTFDSSLLSVAMRRQATKWTALTMGYTSDAINGPQFYL